MPKPVMAAPKAAVPKRCKDCLREGITTQRPAPNPGPRCGTHWRLERARRRAAAHGQHVARHFGISADEYDAILCYQEGSCYVCRRAKGKSKKLAVDHDHGCTVGHPPDLGCPVCVRALCCTTCNRVVLGRYDAAALLRAVEVLTSDDPPAQRALRAYHGRP